MQQQQWQQQQQQQQQQPIVYQSMQHCAAAAANQDMNHLNLCAAELTTRITCLELGQRELRDEAVTMKMNLDRHEERLNYADNRQVITSEQVLHGFIISEHEIAFVNFKVPRCQPVLS